MHTNFQRDLLEVFCDLQHGLTLVFTNLPGSEPSLKNPGKKQCWLSIGLKDDVFALGE